MGYTRTTPVGLGATPIPTDAPVPGQPQPPIYPLQIGSHGAWLEVRASPADGDCGVHGYPCQHPGVDVAGMAGTPVVAPESGTIAVATDGASPPFVGYGPWVVILQGDSGKFHLLGHLEPAAASMAIVGMAVTAGQVLGTTSSANHTHWEVRDKVVPDPGQDNFANNTDPLAWLTLQALGLGAVGPVLIIGGLAVVAWLLLRRRS